MWSLPCLYLHRNEVAVIYPKFINLEAEKRERIINAALKEFAQKGYDKASTNEIIKEAGISKGSLFFIPAAEFNTRLGLPEDS